jgi:exopolysaccharide biosynthesis predicted pyruvyltransferase EpsI
MLEEFYKLSNQLKNIISQETVYYIPNPGNWGDGLIRSGTIKFFRDFNIQFKELGFSRRNWSSFIKPIFTRSTLIYGGGGGWCSDSANGAKYVKYLNKCFKQVIVLPSTYDRTYEYSNTTFFCRDKFESKQNMPDAMFCHDMALYLGKIKMKNGDGNGYFFRNDVESSGKINFPNKNVDISAKGNVTSEDITFFNKIAQYSVIHTDRLHVAIASCLCEREVHLYPNSYFKNEAVFHSSLNESFGNITFHENFDFNKD